MTGRSARPRENLFTELQLLGERLITGRIGAVQIVEQAATLAHHEEHAAAAAVVLLVLLEMLREGVDLLGQKGNLDIGGAGVFGVDSVFGNIFTLELCIAFIPGSLGLSSQGEMDPDRFLHCLLFPLNHCFFCVKKMF